MADSQTKKLYTTHEVAKLIGVTPITVIRWIESGKFKCFTTVGGHRRIEHEELVKFAHNYNLPWQEEEALEKRKEYVVLAVDDDSSILEVLHDMLSDLPNLKLIEVSNAFLAGAKLVEERPDLILLDFLMPELDGFEFCRFMREDPRFKEVPIVAMTGLSSQEDKARMREVGVHDILTKPFSSDSLIEKVEQFRNGKGGSASQDRASA
ncbi:MAG: response regulator [Candidatus Omnitrophota bacterium]|nr:response regulator [Candidatus Omnitrophota bacterium]